MLPKQVNRLQVFRSMQTSTTYRLIVNSYLHLKLLQCFLKIRRPMLMPQRTKSKCIENKIENSFEWLGFISDVEAFIRNIK